MQLKFWSGSGLEFPSNSKFYVDVFCIQNMQDSKGRIWKITMWKSFIGGCLNSIEIFALIFMGRGKKFWTL